MTTPLLRLIAAIQLWLGLAYLLVPHQLLATMGHSALAPDLAYPLGMLAARFIAYGVGLWRVARAPQDHAMWVRLMALIQLIDLGVGLQLTLRGLLPWSLSGFPMFNAVWIAATCAWIARPTAARRQTARP